MAHVFVKDPLRAGVETASGGQCTVLYTRSGRPSYFFVLPAFNLEDIDPLYGPGRHPAFTINGRDVSRLFIGMYQVKWVDTENGPEALSLPGMQPDQISAGWMDYSDTLGTGKTFLSLVSETMPGAHIMTNAEWSAIAMWCAKNGFLPHGNTFSGQDTDHPWERGVYTGFSLYTKTGSGPNSWRHNNAANGIADLVGNMGDFVTGLRLVNGEVQVCQDNNAAAWTSGTMSSQAWKAVNYATGALVAPGTAGTVKVNMDNGGSGFVFANARTLEGKGFMPFEDVAPVTALPMHLCLTGAAGLPGVAEAQNTGTSYPARGGNFVSHQRASIFHYELNNDLWNASFRIVKY